LTFFQERLCVLRSCHISSPSGSPLMPILDDVPPDPNQSQPFPLMATRLRFIYSSCTRIRASFS
jgi:hypothetical protein